MFWLNLAFTLAGIYAIGLIFYRLSLSLRSIKIDSDKLKLAIESLKDIETPDIKSAQTSSVEDLPSLISKRANILKAKEQRAKARERRLIEHLGSIKIEKRQQ
ncbi:MAG: hypothetical protein K9G13_00420 [Aquiluna sp.]|nr:hypothetical protein [Aquiluna sp.]MCF8544999.1 hypothetical protein [Aquiluna sp.]